MPPIKKAKEKQRFDPLEVDNLLLKAKAGDIVARDDLLFRFQRLAASLVHLCITGRPNLWSSSHKAFLKMFGGNATNPLATAAMLRKGLAGFDKEELFHTGQLAILKAIERCTKNLAATIVICMKDEIYLMVKDANSTAVDFLEYSNVLIDDTLEDIVAYDLFLFSLEDNEWEIVQKILAEEEVEEEIPYSLKYKLAHYVERPELLEGIENDC